MQGNSHASQYQVKGLKFLPESIKRLNIFLSDHWIKTLFRDYWFGIKENRTDRKCSGCCQRKCQTPESWERMDENFYQE